MKKDLAILFMVLAAMFVFVSCEEAHTYSDDWSYDEIYHWHAATCGHSSKVRDKAEHSFEVVKNNDEKLVKKCTVCGYESTDEITGTLVSTAEALKTALSGDAKTIYLGADITSSDKVDLKDGTTLDLNGKTLSLSKNDTITESSISKSVSLVVKDKSITIKNGTLKSSGECAYGIVLEKNGKLILDDVQYSALSRAIKVLASADNSSLAVTNSTVETNGGAFAIQTDATPIESTGVTISIKNSTIKAGENTNTVDVKDDSTALMFNVKGTITIENSKFYGRRQGAIFRGGDYTVKDSTFESTSTYTNYYNKSDYVDANWGSGNEVPLAAVVIGNRSGSYPYATNVKFEGSNTLTINETTVRKQLYVYQANTAYTVKVSGADSSWTVNTERNGATYTTK